ncbi:MAG: BolA family transcriptional regulator [SAR86 cluster bacterium]|uniref:BolA family transcriptional regulator n=1 Tax=SAR86 cluster bacterium TaxID=2030880 RepID=A0A520MEU8_9GAMM|nr:MAG: BolA family transcriptional regulator [SAR86 cluster bacterium]|tara:strand:- start:359 stop:667 length:309 start_codon:yes stop_codon:yes gene_type:complete
MTERLIEKKIINSLNENFKLASLKIVNESFMHNVPEGSESHFKIVIVSDNFIKKSLIQRHKEIYKALGEIMNDIHALSIHAFDNMEFELNPMILDSPQCANK